MLNKYAQCLCLRTIIDLPIIGAGTMEGLSLFRDTLIEHAKHTRS